MKTILKAILVSLAFSGNVYAEHMANMPNMQGKNMQQMIQQMQKMQKCLLQVDENQLRQYEQEIAMLDAEIRSLCQQGNRDLAQQKALAFGKRFSESESFKIIQACTKDMQANGFMPTMPQFDNLEGRHVCDDLPR